MHLLWSIMGQCGSMRAIVAQWVQWCSMKVSGAYLASLRLTGVQHAKYIRPINLLVKIMSLKLEIFHSFSVISTTNASDFFCYH